MSTRGDVAWGVGCLLSIVVVPLGLCLLIGLGVEAGFNGELAQIESLREDAGVVAADVGEDVIGQVTQWNQAIANNKYTNTIPVIGFFISDRWESVEPIEVPR